jgi:hypothetical protein
MIKDRAKDVLIKMGMPASILGLKYIADAMALFDSGLEDVKITALYEEIGKKYNVSGSRVERAIRHAFGLVITKGKLSEVEKYLSFNCTTNSNQLNLLYYRLKWEEKDQGTNEPSKIIEVIKPSESSDPYQTLEDDMILAVQKFIKGLREVSTDACSKVG